MRPYYAVLLSLDDIFRFIQDMNGVRKLIENIWSYQL